MVKSDSEKEELNPLIKRENQSTIPSRGNESSELSDSSKKLTAEEEYETGKVYKQVYLIFAKAMGYAYIAGPFLLLTLAQVCVAGGNIWLSLWSSSESNITSYQTEFVIINKTIGNYTGRVLTRSLTSSSEKSMELNGATFDRTMFLIGYATFGFLQALLMFMGILAVTLGALRASRKLHESLVSKTVRFPMSFFDTNPSGRIINRFSKEINVLDVIIPNVLRQAVSYFTQLIVTLIVIATATPLAIVFIIPIMIVYYLIQMVFIATYRQMKRMESITKSPVYSHFSETIQGAPTIRAFKKQKYFITASIQKIERFQRVLYPTININRWLDVQLQCLGNLVTFAAAIVAVASRDSISAGVVGMSVTYALYVTMILGWCVRTTSDIEANAVSVERINEYLQRESEAEWTTKKALPKPWPSRGKVVLSHFQTQYRPGLDLVLRDVSCSFKPAEKVGIVGRTGAGKSSLTLALFRLIEATGGNITIDDVDISSIGLHDLRSQISIIPQDPVLFSGSLRINLDPSGNNADAKVWRALELAHLKDYVSSLPLGLQHVVDEEGSNFSVGQKQLVCLARALLRQSRVLVLDEATAAVDLQTDDLIQTTIRSQFKDCTVFTIAHRLNTIMDYDRVLVLDQGRVIEVDAPNVLLKNPESVFYGLAKEAGLVKI